MYLAETWSHDNERTQTMRIKATMTHKDWTENETSAADGNKLATVHSRYDYTGGLTGSSAADAIITYLASGNGDFCGYELFTGEVDGRAGSFVLRSLGGFEPDAVRADLEIVPDSGTGELTKLRGSGTMYFAMGVENGTVELDLEG
jgi:hypothetical protein